MTDPVQTEVAGLAKLATRQSRALAGFSVVGGVAQLLYIRWAEGRFGSAPLAVILPVLLAYGAVVAWGVIRLARTQRRLRQMRDPGGAPRKRTPARGFR